MGLTRYSRRVAVLLLAAGAAVPAGAAAAVAAPAGAAGSARPAATDRDATTRVVVRGVPGAAAEVERAVAAVGGRITRQLPIIDGVAAVVPDAAVDRLQGLRGVADVAPDTTGRVLAVDPALGYDTARDTGSLRQIAKIVGADKLWALGMAGKGVDVAVIDTGVSPVRGLTGNLVNGPDLSFDSQRADLRYRDGYGHGTHMAGIIAGRDATGGYQVYDKATNFTGIAPEARIVNVKVGASDGEADVSQVIAAIGWVTENRNKNGLNIRVLNLSYGTDSTQDWEKDPLAYAAEAAWRKGILVVVAAGNDGTSNADLADPAMDPNLFAVGASDPNGTVTTLDDVLPEFSNRGTKKRYVDVVAPGTHVLGLRVPNGIVDQTYPASRVGTRFTRGSGTSQATAVVSGAAALLFGSNPNLIPDQVKAGLMRTAVIPPAGTPNRMGAGVIDVAAARALLLAPAQVGRTTNVWGQGTGTLEAARGSVHVDQNGVSLTGEKDIFGRSWAAKTWSAQAVAGTTWTAGAWNGATWTGTGWSGGDWAAPAWTAKSWAGNVWSARAWTTRTLTDGGWDGRSWVSDAWAGRRWVSASWASGSWS